MKKLFNGKKGITLIALIVTIIVLLILAGTSISILTGSNGILNMAINAREKVREEGLKEEVILAVQSAITKGSGVLTKKNLQTELQNISKAQVTYDESTQKFTVSRDHYAFSVDLSGEVVSANGIALDKSTLNLLTGKSETLVVSYVGNASGAVTWSSSDTSVAEVDSTGKVTAEGSGTVTITAGCGSYKATCTVKVVSTVTNITAEDLTLAIDSSSKITLTTTPAGDVEDLNYTSSDTSIATVDSEGNVKGVKAGTATITITGSISTNISETCTVTVREFADYSWEEISKLANAIAQDSSISNYTTQTSITKTIDGKIYKVKIGDKKPITIGSETNNAVVIGFKHDDVTDLKKAGISFQIEYCLKTTAQMNSTNTNSGSWAASTMRSYLNTNTNSIYSQLESELKKVIQPVKKVTGDYANQSDDGLITTSDYLWLLSEREVFGDDEKGWYTSISNEWNVNTLYSYYRINSTDSRVKEDGSGKGWWLRSPRCSDDIRFCTVRSDGNPAYDQAIDLIGVSFGFAI